MDSFNEDLRKSNLSNNGELPTIIDQYEKTLKETLQKHAPLKRLGIIRKLAKPKDSVGNLSVVGEHLDYVSIERCMLNSVGL